MHGLSRQLNTHKSCQVSAKLAGREKILNAEMKKRERRQPRMDTDLHGFYRRKTEETERKKVLEFHDSVPNSPTHSADVAKTLPQNSKSRHRSSSRRMMGRNC